MSKVILIASRAVSVPYEKNCDYIGVDRGAYIAMQQDIPLVCAIGDFDSISEDEKQILSNYTKLITLPVRKNETDSEAAIHYALEHGYDEIVLYGGFGGRIDHSLANLYLLMNRNYALTLQNETNIIKVLMPGKYTVFNNYRHLSFLALEDTIISETGVAYPLHEQFITTSDIYSVSNEILGESAKITIHSGRVLMIQSNDQ